MSTKNDWNRADRRHTYVADAIEWVVVGMAFGALLFWLLSQ